jgi:hypothetical protein
MYICVSSVCYLYVMAAWSLWRLCKLIHPLWTRRGPRKNTYSASEGALEATGGSIWLNCLYKWSLMVGIVQ